MLGGRRDRSAISGYVMSAGCERIDVTSDMADPGTDGSRRGRGGCEGIGRDVLSEIDTASRGSDDGDVGFVSLDGMGRAWGGGVGVAAGAA